MKTIGMIAMFGTDAFAAQPPHRPRRSGRRNRQGAGIVGIVRRFRTAVANAFREADATLPSVTRSYPY